MDFDGRVVLLPFMAQGHFIPFLALARQIQQRSGFRITIVNTPINVRYLRDAISRDPAGLKIELVELPFCSADHGLPPEVESADGLSRHQLIGLMHASTTLQASFHKWVSEISEECRPPICIISDVFFGWASEVANSVGTTNITFTTGGAYGTAAYVSLWLNLPHRNTESDEFALPGFPESCRFHRSQLHEGILAADGTDEWSRFLQRQISLSLRSAGWLCNTAEEIEPLGLEILGKLTGLLVWTIGPLLPPALLDNTSSDHTKAISHGTGRKHGIDEKKCLEWLSSKPQRSVLYVAFGSQNTISAAQMMELAIGLELSAEPFIWVIQPPLGFDVNSEFRAEWLPEGFERRMVEKNQGLLVHRWAPQVAILAHRSTGAFLSHCGWNSTVEGLSRGVPVIGWPLVAEQPYNSKMLVEEMGVCVELARGMRSRVVAEEVKRVVKMVMEEGGELRKNAEEIGEKIRAAMRDRGGQKGSSLRAMDDFVGFIMGTREKRGDLAE